MPKGLYKLAEQFMKKITKLIVTDIQLTKKNPSIKILIILGCCKK
jgi:hypothetical protein